MSALFSSENELFRVYVFYSSVLVLKLLVMSSLTAIQRIKNKSFANPEDSAPLKLKPKVHENVERVRRAHLNDLENITAFFVASFGYILTNPSVVFATLLFRAFVGARFIHTFVYAIYVLPQPARALSWGVGYAITGYMAFQTVIYFM